MTELKYRSDIDGLRALAVLPVVIFHAGADWLSGGFVGVDIFFVISGYLISLIIIKDVEAGRFSFSKFYKRRAKRILPALLVVLFVTVLVFQFIALPEQSVEASVSAIAAVFSVSNFYFWGESGYFSPSTDFMPLLHTWSLGVEEQFYLLFPILLIVIVKTKISPFGVLAVGFVFAFLLNVWLSLNYPSFSYYLLPARAWELAMGSLLAAGRIPVPKKSFYRELLPALGLGLILFSFFYIDSQAVFPGWLAVMPCVGAALIINGDGSSFVASKILSSKVMVFIGLLSYSLYLWHWPVLTAFRVGTASAHLDVSIAVFGVIISFLIGWLSWRYVERPFRKPNNAQLMSRMGWVFPAVGLLLIASVSIFFQGFPGRLNENASQLLAATKDIDPYRSKCADLDDLEHCRFGNESAPVTYAVIGDSHAASIRAAVEASGLMDGRAGTLYWSSGCPLLDGARRVDGHMNRACSEFKNKVWELIENNNDIETVFLAGRWPVQLTGMSPEIGGSYRVLLHDDYSESLSKSENFNVFSRAMQRTLERFSIHGIKVIIIGSVPEPGFNVPKISALASYLGLDVPGGISRESVDERAGMADRFILSFLPEDVVFLSIWNGFCEGEFCDVARGGVPIYYDDDHLSNSASLEIVAPLLADSKIL